MIRRTHLLTGGYLNEGAVTRVGRTVVRKQDHPWPMAVSEALEVLRTRNFPHCPRELQRLDACSVVLTYLPGRALSNPVPKWAAGKRALVETTKFMRQFSIASADMRSQLS